MSFNTGFSSVESEEQALEVVKFEPRIIDSINADFLTDDVLFEALSRDTHCYEMIDVNNLSSRLIGRLLLDNHEVLGILPNRLFTKQHLMNFVKANGLNIVHIPEYMLTNDICNAAVLENAQAHQYVPEKLQDNTYVNILIKSNPSYVSQVDIEQRDHKLLAELIDDYPIMIRYMIMSERTKEICMKVLNKDAELIQFFPEHIYDDLEVLEAISELKEFQNPDKVEYEDFDEVKDGEVEDGEVEYPLKRNLFKSNIVRPSLAAYLFQKDKEIFRHLPIESIDIDLAKLAIEYNPINIFCVNAKLKADGKLWEYALTKDESLYDDVPENERSSHVRIFIARKHAENEERLKARLKELNKKDNNNE